MRGNREQAVKCFTQMVLQTKKQNIIFSINISFSLDDLDLHEQTVKRNIECGTILIWFWLDSCQLCLCFFLLNCNPPSYEKIISFLYNGMETTISISFVTSWALLMVKGIAPKCVIMRDIFIAIEYIFFRDLIEWFFGY